MGNVESHQLFRLTTANSGQHLVSIYVKLDLELFGIKVPEVGVLVTKELSELLDNQHKTKPQGIICWNVMKLVNDVLKRKYGSQVFKNFDCLVEVSQCCF